MAKRKATKEDFQSKQPRFEDDSDLEQAMHDFADEFELWGTIDEEELICDAVDEYERHNQVGHGQPEPAQPPPQQPEPVQPQPAQPPQAALNNSITSSTFIPTNNRDLLAAFRELEHKVQKELRR